MSNIKRGETTSKKIAQIASKGLRNPAVLTKTEIRKLAGSALTQKVARRSK